MTHSRKPSVSAEVLACSYSFSSSLLCASMSWLCVHLSSGWYRRTHLKQRHVLELFGESQSLYWSNSLGIYLCSLLFPSSPHFMPYFTTECPYIFSWVFIWLEEQDCSLQSCHLSTCSVFQPCVQFFQPLVQFSNCHCSLSTLAPSTKLLYSLGKETTMWVVKNMSSICFIPAISLVM